MRHSRGYHRTVSRNQKTSDSSEVIALRSAALPSSAVSPALIRNTPSCSGHQNGQLPCMTLHTNDLAMHIPFFWPKSAQLLKLAVFFAAANPSAGNLRNAKMRISTGKFCGFERLLGHPSGQLVQTAFQINKFSLDVCCTCMHARAQFRFVVCACVRACVHLLIKRVHVVRCVVTQQPGI